MAKKETDVAKPICDWLAAEGWEVYTEVVVDTLGPRADIVAINGNLSWIIEVKTHYSLRLLNQAMLWLQRRRSNYVSVAVPHSKTKYDCLSRYFHRDKGIGLIKIRDDYVHVSHAAKLNRRVVRNIKDCVYKEQKTFCNAGSANGGYYTPFKSSVIKLKEYLRDHPESTMKEVIESIADSLHWSSKQTAKACISKYIDTGVIEGVEKVYNPGEPAMRLRLVAST